MISFNSETKELRTGGEDPKAPDGGFGRELFCCMKKYHEEGRIAQIEGETGIEETYDDLLRKSIKIALYLKQQGVKPGDIISICSANTLNNGAVLFASLFVGAILSPTDPILSESETQFLMELVQPKIIFVCESSHKLLKHATTSLNNGHKIIALYNDGTDENVESIFMQFTSEEIDAFESIYIEDTTTTACILFSSGTSGFPKAACLSHNTLAGDLVLHKEKAKSLGISTVRVLSYTTLYWLSGLHVVLYSAYFGVSRVVLRKFVAESVWDDLERLKVNIFYLSYSNGIQSISYLRDHKLPNLIALGVLGGILPAHRHADLQKKLPHVLLLTAYGLTEITLVASNDGDITPEYAYRPVAKNLIIKIVDGETETPLDLNQSGEIRVKGFGQINEYYRQNSTDCWDQDGFFKTGDLGYIDENYYIYVVDRIKEMFKYRSWRVSPAKPEYALKEHPAVEHGIIIGVPHEIDDNHALAIVVLKKGCSVSANELTTFINERMDDLHKIRAGVKFIKEEEIPYTASGKISRIKLKAMFAKPLV